MSNAAKLYQLIKDDPGNVQALFRQALQDPQGAVKAICDFGDSVGLPVTQNEVKDYLASLDDDETKKWVIKARGGL